LVLHGSQSHLHWLHEPGNSLLTSIEVLSRLRLSAIHLGLRELKEGRIVGLQGF
jgi:hypothetical protein